MSSLLSVLLENGHPPPRSSATRDAVNCSISKKIEINKRILKNKNKELAQSIDILKKI